MNKALYGILWFVLWILVFTSINQSSLFTDASESSEGLIEQLDAILVSPKFDDRDYCVSIMEKTNTLAAIFDEDTVPYLAMMYIHANLKVKVSNMPLPVAQEEVPEVVADEKELHNAAQKQQDTEVSITNEYRGTTWYPLPPKEKEAAKSDTAAADLGGFNVWRKAAPTTVQRSVRKMASDAPSYKYQVDSDLYNIDCTQKRCVDSCLNLDAGYSESLCKKECISDVCLEVKANNKLLGREINFAPKN